MLSSIVAMIAILAVAAVIAGLVVIGLEGRGRRRAPHMADTMAKAAHHLNGDGRPPKVLTKLLS